MKQRMPKAIYSKEFREQAAKQVTEEGLSAKEAARRLKSGGVLCQESAVKRR